MKREIILRKRWDERADLLGQSKVSGYENMWSWSLRKKFVLKNTEDHMISLDVGCGPGEITKIITKKSSIAVGLDISSKLLCLAQKHNAIQNVIQGELSHLPFKNNVFTHVFCTEVIQHVSDIDDVIREISRVLKREGKLIISFPNYYYHPRQRRILKGDDISNKDRTFIVHRNEDIYSALQKNGIKIQKIGKIPYNFLPSFICFAIGIVGIKHEMV